MHLKDYYQILEIEPSATQQEIKKAYRKLALQYHPDKNNNDPYAAVQFTEIKEAYEVLTNPAKKEYYLQQRWYAQSTGNRKTQAVITPVNILNQALELEKYVSKLDIHRMDKKGLSEYLLAIINDSTITQLKTFHEPEITSQIILLLLNTTSTLNANQAEKISVQLHKLSDDDETSRYITAALQQSRKKEKLEIYQPYVIALAAIIICFLIWLLSR